METMRGAYGDDGRVLEPLGDPRPDMPDTDALLFLLFANSGTLLFLLLANDVETLGRTIDSGFVCVCKFECDDGDVSRVPDGDLLVPRIESTVDEDLDVGTVALLPLLSVDLSVWKLAFDLLRRSLKKDGAICREVMLQC